MAAAASTVWDDPPLSVSGVAAPDLLSFESWAHLRDALRLSERELVIVQGIFSDEDPKNISLSLNISTDTFYTALQRIYVKLHIGSRAELIVRVMSENLAFVADESQMEFCGWPYWVPKGNAASR